MPATLTKNMHEPATMQKESLRCNFIRMPFLSRASLHIQSYWIITRMYKSFPNFLTRLSDASAPPVLRGVGVVVWLEAGSACLQPHHHSYLLRAAKLRG